MGELIFLGKRYVLAAREISGEDNGYSLEIYQVYEERRLVAFIPSKKGLADLAQRCIADGFSIDDKKSLSTLKERKMLSEPGSADDVAEKPVTDKELDDFYDLLRSLNTGRKNL